MRNVTIWNKTWAIIVIIAGILALLTGAPVFYGFTSGISIAYGVWILCARTIVWESERHHD